MTLFLVFIERIVKFI